MKERMIFDYFYSSNAEQYTFYRIPKLLFTAEYFKQMSCDAKVLYGLMLDRMGLSLKNHWIDEEGRVYIAYSIADISELLGCASQKAVKLIAELEQKGLISKRRLGLGRSNIFYVKNFMRVDIEEEVKTVPPGNEKPGEPDEPELQTEKQFENTSVKKESVFSQNGENQNSGIIKNTNQEILPSSLLNGENHNSRTVKITSQEFCKSLSSDTEKNKSDLDLSIHPSIQQSKADYPQIIQTVRKHISYAELVHDDPGCQEQLDEIVELISEILEMPETGMIRIDKSLKRISTVQGRYRKLNMSHIQYVLNCLEETSKKTRIHNIKGYLLTMLYNAPVTVKNHFSTLVAYDMAHWEEGENADGTH